MKKKGIYITSPNILARYMKTDGQELQRFINATVLWKGSYNYIYLKFRLGCKSDKCGVWVMVFNATFIGGGNRKTRRKPLTCRKLLTNLIT